MTEIVLRGVTKRFGEEATALDNFEATFESGEFIVLVGPSGCGKSTLLRLIAGLETVTAGRIEIGGRDVTDVAPQDRDIAMVFQNYALYPHMTVRENLSYGLRVRRTARPETERRVNEASGMLDIEALLDRRPAALSGGQRQRVAMGRAIVREPSVFLMDEPLSNLDAKLRVAMRSELSRLHARLHRTTVYVTHDQVEAMTLGQRVVVMRDGRIQQFAAPQELYQKPANLFVAAFIGSPAMNLVKASIDGNAVRFADVTLPLDPARRPPAAVSEVVLGIRPHDFADPLVRPGWPTMEVVPAVVEHLGVETHAIFELAAPRVETDSTRAAAGGDSEQLITGRRAIFTARVEPETEVRAGEPIVLAIDTRKLHFFDPADSAAFQLDSSG